MIKLTDKHDDITGAGAVLAAVVVYGIALAALAIPVILVLLAVKLIFF